METPFPASLAYRVHKLVLLMEHQADQELKTSLDISFNQFLMLVAIVQHSKGNQRAIATFLQLTEAAVSRHVDLLVKRSLITRMSNKENRREHIVAVTPTGRHMYAEAVTLISALSRRMFAVLTPAEQSEFETSLDTLLTNLCSAQ